MRRSYDDTEKMSDESVNVILSLRPKLFNNIIYNSKYAAFASIYMSDFYNDTKRFSILNVLFFQN